MKKVWLVFLLCIPFILSACSDPVADELIVYVNEELSPLYDLEEEVIREYESVMGDNYIDDFTVYTHLEGTVIPLYGSFIDQLEAIEVKNAEVREVHELYIAAANKQYNAMVKMLGAIESQDYDMISEANELLAQGRAGMREFNGELNALLEEYNIELEEQEEITDL